MNSNMLADIRRRCGVDEFTGDLRSLFQTAHADRKWLLKRLDAMEALVTSLQDVIWWYNGDGEHTGYEESEVPKKLLEAEAAVRKAKEAVSNG